MATKPKESTGQPKTKSNSAPSTPRSSDNNANAKSKFTNSSEVDTTPHYLRPTISSCNVACKNKQSSEILGPSGRRLTSRRSLDKPPSPPIQPVKAPTRTQNNGTGTSLKPMVALKTISDKPSKKVNNVKPRLSRTKSLPKGAISIMKRTEANGSSSAPVKAKQKARVPSVDAAKPESGIQEEKDQSTVNSPQSKTTEEMSAEATEKEQQQFPKGAEVTSDDDNEQSEGSGEIPGAAELSPHGGKAVTNIEEAPMRLKFKEREKMAISGEEMMMETESMALKKGEAKGKKEPPAGNDVIEEATKRMAEKRNKVKALVGAFETVMSLHEPEGQHGQGQQSSHQQGQHDQQHPKENEEDEINLMKDEHHQNQEQQEKKANEVVVEAVEDANAEQEDEIGQHQKETDDSDEAVDVVAANDGQPVQLDEDNEDAKEPTKSRENNGERNSSEDNY